MSSHILVENSCSRDKLDGIFQPIIGDAMAAYQTIFGASLINTRLTGSVARGEAGPHSDIDFIAVVDTNPTEAQMRQLEQQEMELKQRHPVVARVDLEAVAAHDLHPFRRLVFASDSLSLWGVDRYTVPSQLWDRRELAELITPDLHDIVSGYRNGVAAIEEGNRDRLRFYSRIIGKDILKCYRRIVLLNGGSYERNIGRIHWQLLEFLPEQRDLLDELYELYSNPSDDKRQLLRVLEAASAETAST